MLVYAGYASRDPIRGLKLVDVNLEYDLEYTYIFHSPGLEPWLSGILKRVRPRSVLDVGCGLGFWGFILKGYLGVPHVVGVDIDPVRVEFARRLSVYDELYVSDIRVFNRSNFDVVIAIESVHGILDEKLLERLEGLSRRGGLVVLALPSLPRSINVRDLIRRGYVVYRYFLRGFVLVRVDRAEVLTLPGRLWRILGVLVKILHPLLRFLRCWIGVTW